MIQQRILCTGLCIAVISVVCSNDAEARWRCRNRFSNYGYSTTYTYGYGSGTQGTVMNPPMNTGTTMATPVVPQTNSVNRPTYADPALPANQVQVTAPQPVVTNPAPVIVNQGQVNNGPGNTLPSNPDAAEVQTNSSPNPDNEGRNSLKTPGTAPTKAPAPAANANP